MNLFNFLKPRSNISEQEISTGLRWLTLEGLVSYGFNSITTSGVLAAYALVLGANNLQIGIMAAIPFLMHIFQIPGIWVVEKLRCRKAIAFSTFFFVQLLWAPIALIPFFVQIPGASAVTLMLVLMIIGGFLRAITHSAWNSWVRDLVPQQILGRFYSRRLALSVAVSIIFSLGAALFIDYWSGRASGDQAVYGYTFVILFGVVFLAMASPVFMTLMPEPLMPSAGNSETSIIGKLFAPFRDANFRKLMQFLFTWNAVSNLAIPFFTVYMLQRLGLPLSSVIGLSILSQLMNILFFRVWGPLLDKFGVKAVLSLCASLLLLVIFGWTFTAMPGRHFLTVPLLIILHIFSGIATAGVTIGASTIGLKMAPQGEATSYLAGASLATNLGTGLGPLAGGLLADFFSSRHLALTVHWTNQAYAYQFPLFTLTGMAFLFLIAFIAGIPALGMLASIHEKGESRKEDVLYSLMTMAREFSRPAGSGISFNILNHFPLNNIRRLPIIGLDVALGVTIFQFAHMARLAALAASRSRNIAIKAYRTLTGVLTGVWEYRQVIMELNGEIIAREAAYHAINIRTSFPLDADRIENAVMLSVVKAMSQSGARPEDAVLGASEGILRAAVEAQVDPALTVYQIAKIAEALAPQIGLSRERAVKAASEGMLTEAGRCGQDIARKVKEQLEKQAAAGNPG